LEEKEGNNKANGSDKEEDNKTLPSFERSRQE